MAKNPILGTTTFPTAQSRSRSCPVWEGASHSSKATCREWAIHFLVGMLLRLSVLTMSKPWQGWRQDDSRLVCVSFESVQRKNDMLEPERTGSLVGRWGKRLFHAKSQHIMLGLGNRFKFSNWMAKFWETKLFSVGFCEAPAGAPIIFPFTTAQVTRRPRILASWEKKPQDSGERNGSMADTKTIRNTMTPGAGTATLVVVFCGWSPPHSPK